MADLKTYLLAVISAAVVCGVLCNAVQNTASAEQVRFLCRICFAITLIAPLSSLFHQDWLPALGSSQESTAWVTQEGIEMNQQEMKSIITQKVEAYIVSIAQERGLSVQAQVLLNDEMLPCGAVMQCQDPELSQAQLSPIIEMVLGISKEDQQWIG